MTAFLQIHDAPRSDLYCAHRRFTRLRLALYLDALDLGETGTRIISGQAARSARSAAPAIHLALCRYATLRGGERTSPGGSASFNRGNVGLLADCMAFRCRPERARTRSGARDL